LNRCKTRAIGRGYGQQKLDLRTTSFYTQRTKTLKFKTEIVLKKYLIAPVYLNFRNDLNVVLNFSVDTVRLRHQSGNTEIFSIQHTRREGGFRTFRISDCKKDLKGERGLMRCLEIKSYTNNYFLFRKYFIHNCDNDDDDNEIY
jgi:hypothetical protein